MKDYGMKQFNMVNCFIEKSTDLKFLKHEKDYLSMLIVTDESYVYAEKYYENQKLQSCLTIKIFKEQERTKVNYEHFKNLIFSNILKNKQFDEAEFLKTLRTNRIYFHRWHEKNGKINTSTSI